MIEAARDITAQEYLKVSTCPDCNEGEILSEIEVLELMRDQESYSTRVEESGAYAATTLDLIQGILALDSQNESYSDHSLVDLIEQAIKYHRNHRDKD